MSLKPKVKASFSDTSKSSGAVALAAKKYRDAMIDPKARDRLIEDYLPLVKSLVSRLRHHFPDSYAIEDMYGIGARALVVSVNHYDPSKGKGFGNYAALRIKGALLDELRKIDCLPRANRAKAKSLQSTISEMETRLKRSVSVDEVRNELSLSNSAYAKLLKETQPVTFVPIDVPLDNDVNSGGNSSLADTISDPTELDASEITENKDKVALLREEIKKLPDPQKKILLLYYYEELKLSEIAQIFGLTEGRISQILSHSVLALRSHFQSIL